MSQLSTKDLAPRRFDEALALARAVEPRLTRAGWRRYLRRLLGREGGGLLAVENARGTLLALAAYRPRATLAGDTCLDCDPIAVFDLAGGTPVAEALVQALERRAGELGCGSIHSHVLGAGRRADSPVLRSFHARGHLVEATHLCKNLMPPSDPLD